MAIVEDASTPAIEEGTGGANLTTASFSPPAGSLVVAMTALGWNGNAGTPGISVSDSSGGGAWSGVNAVSDSAAGGAASIFYRYFASAPGSITVSSSFTNGAGATNLVVKVLAGVDDSDPIGSTGTRVRGSGSDVHESVTPTVIGSQIYVANNLDFTGSASPSSTLSGTSVYSYTRADSAVACAFGSTALSDGLTQETYGYSVGDASPGALVHLEVLPAPEPSTPTGPLAATAPSAQAALTGHADVPPRPEFVGAGAMDSAAGAITPGLPAGWQEDDVFILTVDTVGGEAVTAPAGWTEVATSPQSVGNLGASSTRCTVWWRRATASESAPTVTGAVDHANGVITAYRGCATDGIPIDATGGGVDSTTDTTASIAGFTTVEDNALVVMNISSTDGVAANTLSLTGTNLSELTERVDAGSSAFGNGGKIGVYTGIMAAAGATGTATLTTGTATRNAWVLLSLKPLQLVTGSSSLTAPSAQVAVEAEKTIDAGLAFAAPSATVQAGGEVFAAGPLAAQAASAQVEVRANVQKNFLNVVAPGPSAVLVGAEEVIDATFGVTAPAPGGELLAEATATGPLDLTAPGATFGAEASLTAAGPLGMTVPAAALDATGHEYAIGPLTLSAPFPSYLMGAETRIFGRRVKVVEPDPYNRVMEVPEDAPPETFYV